MSGQSDLDRTFERIERLAKTRGLEGIERSTSYRTPALKVGGRVLARLKDDTTLVLQCPQDQKMLLLEISPAIYFETDHYIGHDAILIRLAQIGDEELSLRLEDAWKFRSGR